MGAEVTLTVGFGRNPELSGSVIIEQGDWSAKIGLVSKIDIIKAMSANIFGVSDFQSAAAVDCGMDPDGESYTCRVYVYPTPGDLNFNIGVTNGSIRSGILESVQLNETSSFSLDTEGSTKYTPESTPAASFVGDVFNEDGDDTSAAISISENGEITVNKKVYGDVNISYTTKRYVYTITVPARQDSANNVFQSVVYVWWDGGVALKELSAPPNAEKSYSNGTTCDGRNLNGELEIVYQDDDSYVPKIEAKNKEVYLNYCDDFK